jgi:7-cyano-7-deazaguanine synthase in queuosine biosynthesis
MLCRSNDIYPLFVDYGQEPVIEEHAAAQFVTRILRLRPLRVLHVELSLTFDEHEQATLSPYFIPHRNMILVALAENYAASIGATAVSLGFVADTDTRLFPDATSQFIEDANRFLMSTYQHQGTFAVLDGPVAGLHKRDLIEYGVANSFPCDVTYSCYHGGGRCGRCPSCSAVLKAFAEVKSGKSPELVEKIDAVNPYVVHVRR